MKRKLLFSILFVSISLTLNSDPNPLVINKDNKDGTVTDLRTKLIWLKCSIGQKNPNNCTGNTSDFEWEDAVKECKNLTLGGKKWRLPTIEELETLVISDSDSSEDTSTFPNSQSSYYWSSSNEVDKKNFSYYKDFSTNQTGYDNNTNLAYVRCVTGTYKPPTYINNNDGTIKDPTTNLIWQKCSVGQKNDKRCSFSSFVYEWEDALSYCESLTLADKRWRVPSLSELQSLVIKIDRKNPYIDNAIFPNTKGNYWTSETVMCTDSSYYVHFPSGHLGSDSRNSRDYFLRSVAND
jgi:hypothetical protein